MKPREHGLRQQFVINVSSNIALFLLNFLLNMWFIPYLIRHLGVSVYGIVPLTTTLIAYCGLLTLSFNSAVGRFLTINLQQGLFSIANQIFNTAFFISLFLSGLLIPFAVGIIWATPYLFKLPPGQENGSQVLIALSILAFIVTTIESNFAVSSWAYNRFDLRNGVALVSRLVQVGIVIFCFSLVEAQVWYVGLGLVGATSISCIGSVILWRFLTPQLRVQFTAFDRSQLRQLFGMSGWVFVNQIGSLFFLNTDLIIVNHFFRPEIAGQYGTILQLVVYIRSGAQMLVSVLTPTILAQYAENDRAGMNRISQQVVKFLGIVMAIPVGLLCGFASPFLVVWLGPSFREIAPLMVLLMVHLCINLALLPLFSIQIAFNKVRWPGIVTLMMGVANVVLAVAMAKWSPWGVLGVAVAGGVTLTLKNAVFTPIYSAVIQEVLWWKFLPPLSYSVIGTVAVSLTAYLISQRVIFDSWLTLILASVVVTGFYSGIVYLCGLNPQERTLLKNLIPRVR